MFTAEAVVCQVWFTSVLPATQEDRLISEILEQLGNTDPASKEKNRKVPGVTDPQLSPEAPVETQTAETEPTTCISVTSRDADAASLRPHSA